MTFLPKPFIPANESKEKHTNNLNGYGRVSGKELAILELVVHARLGHLHNKSSLWVIILNKIVLASENAPQIVLVG
jgi:hypothetical protein